MTWGLEWYFDMDNSLEENRLVEAVSQYREDFGYERLDDVLRRAAAALIRHIASHHGADMPMKVADALRQTADLFDCDEYPPPVKWVSAQRALRRAYSAADEQVDLNLRYDSLRAISTVREVIETGRLHELARIVGESHYVDELIKAMGGDEVTRAEYEA
jgi:hypothetical protein